MATSTPSSLSRNRNEYADIYEFSSILGKREPAFGEDATIQPDAKRPARRGPPPPPPPPPAGDRESQDGNEFDLSSVSSSSGDEDENEVPAVFESDSKSRSGWSTKVTEGKMGTLVMSQLTLITSLELQSPFRPRVRRLARSKSSQLARTRHLL
jgi:hypothetical protein